MQNELVVKSNQVIEASYRLSVVEQRVVLSAIAKIPKMSEVSDDEIYTVSVQDLQALGVHEKTAYRDLKEAVNRLYERSISLDIDNKSIKMRWVQRIEFTDNQGIIALRFSKDILPFISNVKANFTQYMLSEVSKMQGAYSVRIYELLTQYKSIGERSIAIEDLRIMLDLGSRYKTTGNLIAWVIDPSIQEINEQTDLKITAEPQKTGRKFTHVKFGIKQKQKSKTLDPKRDPNTPDFFIKMTDAQRHLFANKMSEMPEMSKYSEGTESYQQFTVRIAKMLLQPEKFREFYPILEKAGYK